MQKVGNLSLRPKSWRVCRDVNDDRRGEGVFEKVMHAMDLLKEHGLCYLVHPSAIQVKTIRALPSDEFIKMLVDEGMPLCSGTSITCQLEMKHAVDLLLTPEQREYMIEPCT